MGKESDLQDLEYLVTCRQALSSNREDQVNLENRLKERDVRNKLVLPEESPERNALEAKLQEKKDFYAAVMEDLKKFEIGGFRGLSEKINDLKNRYPDQERRIEEIKSEYKEWHATQSDYSHQGQQAQQEQQSQQEQQGQSDQGRPQTREKRPGYNEAFEQQPSQTQKPEPKQLTEYDRVFQVTTTSSGPSPLLEGLKQKFENLKQKFQKGEEKGKEKGMEMNL